MKVAFSKTSITPKVYLGKPLAGYDREERCSGILDELHAYGVLIGSENKKNKDQYLLLISVDTLKLPLSIVQYVQKKIVSKITYLKPENILIHATHTHASFDLTGEFHYQGGALAFMNGVMFADNKNDYYIVWMVNKIVLMVQELFNNLSPCKMAWKKKKFNPELVLNRRWPTREVSPDLGVISFKKLDRNELIGIIVNYACHPTSLSYKNHKLSADYPGRIISKISEKTDNKLRSVYFNGPSGDLNPITTSGVDYERIEKDKNITYDQLGTYNHTQHIGSTIGEEALRLASSIDDEQYVESIGINVYTKELLIPLKDARYFSKVWFSNKLKWVLKKYFLFSIAKFDKRYVNFPFFTVKKNKFKKCGKTIIKYLKLDNITEKGNFLGIVTVPGELFEDLGRHILSKAPSLEKDIFIFQNCQDWIGYLFSLKMYIDEGGYEPFMCFSPLCGDIVESETINLLDEVNQ